MLMLIKLKVNEYQAHSRRSMSYIRSEVSLPTEVKGD